MSRLVKVIPSKVYKTEQNAIKAIEKKLLNEEVRYFISRTEDGAYYPILLGGDAIRYAVSYGFCCIA